MIAELTKLLAAKKVAYTKCELRVDELKRQRGRLVEKAELSQKVIVAHRKASVFFQSLSDDESNKFQTKLETLVTAGLQVVFQEPMKFCIDVGTERNTITVRFFVESLVNGYKAKLDILSAKGGGVADVVAFLLQFLMVHYLPNRRRIIIADEPWKNLSADYKARFASFVKMICKKADLQVIIVTHDPEYSDVADKVYKFSLGDKGLTDVISI